MLIFRNNNKIKNKINKYINDNKKYFPIEYNLEDIIIYIFCYDYLEINSMDFLKDTSNFVNFINVNKNNKILFVYQECIIPLNQCEILYNDTLILTINYLKNFKNINIIKYTNIDSLFDTIYTYFV